MRKWIKGTIKDQAETFTMRRRKAEKLLKGWGYTPTIARTLSGILCNLTEETNARRQEALGLFTRIAEGK